MYITYSFGSKHHHLNFKIVNIKNIHFCRNLNTEFSIKDPLNKFVISDYNALNNITEIILTLLTIILLLIIL